MKYVPDSAGLEELLRGTGAQSMVRQFGESLRNQAGDGFVTSYQQGASRFRGILYADTFSARARNRRDNTLVRVLG